MAKFESITQSLEPHFEESYASLSRDIQQRLEDGFFGKQLVKDWDSSTPNQRRKMAVMWDYLHDPDPAITTTEQWLDMSLSELPQEIRHRLERDSLSQFWEDGRKFERRKIIQQGDTVCLPEPLEYRLRQLDAELKEKVPEESPWSFAWDPIPLSGIAQMYRLENDPAINNDRWRLLADQASRNGLSLARIRVGGGKAESTFHPWEVANWLANRGILPREKVDRILLNNLPTRSKHLRDQILL